MAGNALIKLRRDTAANWTASNPVLAVGEPGVETVTGKFKIGDGATAWVSLAYIVGSSSPASATVTNRTAAYTETATTGEYLNLCNLGAGFAVTLPTASGNTAKLHYKKLAAAGQITITRAGTDLIDGGTTAVLNNQYEAITLISDGATNWEII